MAIHRGAQSALFWYLSCAPCADARYKKKLKQDAIRGRAEREALEAEMPGMYRHPSPSSTNPHWQTEIEAGPVLVARGGKRKNKNNNNNGADRRRNLKTSMTQSSNDSNLSSSVNLSLGSRDGRVDSKVHFQQYQRPNEEGTLEYASIQRLASNSTLDASSYGSRVTRPPRAHTRGLEAGGDYTNVRNPQINDLHPATVTKIKSKEEARFLMRPPPTADFTSGRSMSARSRSDSGGSSRLSAISGVPFPRGLAQTALERRIRSGDAPLTPTLSQESTPRTVNDSLGQGHDRYGTEEKDFAIDNSPSKKQKTRRSTIQVQLSEDSTDSATTVVRNPDLVPERMRARKVASKPQLSTIVSDSTIAAEHRNEVRKENRSSPPSDNSLPARDRTERRSAVLMKDDSLRVLQDLAPNSAIFKTQVVSPRDLRIDPIRRSRQPSQDTTDEHPPELYDSWYTPDFALPEWVHEHTKREVKHRWSMDI